MSFCKQSLVRQGVPVPVGSAAGAAQSQMVSKFTYVTDDADSTLESAGYFNLARGVLKKGDIIEAVVSHSGSVELKVYVATAVPASGNVTVALQSTT